VQLAATYEYEYQNSAYTYDGVLQYVNCLLKEQRLVLCPSRLYAVKANYMPAN